MKIPHLALLALLALGAASAAAPTAAREEGAGSKLAPGSHFADLQGVRIHYMIRGHGPLVVVQAPGWGIGTEYLEKGLAPLAKRFTVLTYDPRGTGLSSPVAATDHIGNVDLAENLEQLRAYLGLPSMNLVGHSNGSAIAILYAERHPERVGKLVLIGSQLLGYKGAPGPVELAERARRRTDPAFSRLDALMAGPTPQTDAAFTKQFKGYAGFFFYDPTRDARVLVAAMTKPMSVRMYKAFEESPPADRAPPLADLAKITARTLIVEGRQDPACPLTESERIRQGIASSELVAIDHAGHFPWIEQPSAFFAPVIRFLAS
ncbi:alpha/beta fold hydrolase [Sphingomonas sp. TDK1]|uniref:alpha/beta fold hydrolase n=1 Tax=Sphingomonas sp. TDK1 TaxID=453247 RepID=UPI0007DA082F|nr:alpha/beta hydrolase [Sphingomonas sp. TDK1]OAN62272.1 hypothetical protein A7X12_22550 [Sphingomonas sp. TDK1]